MPKPARRRGESEEKYLARRQAYDSKLKADAKAAGKSDAQISYDRRKAAEAEIKAGKKPKPKPKPTPQQQRSTAAAKRRQAIVKSTPGTSGLQMLADTLAGKKKKKKKEK